MKPYAGAFGGEGVVADIGDLRHVAEDHAVRGQALTQRTQRRQHPTCVGVELRADARAVVRSVSGSSAPAAPGLESAGQHGEAGSGIAAHANLRPVVVVELARIDVDSDQLSVDG